MDDVRAGGRLVTGSAVAVAVASVAAIGLSLVQTDQDGLVANILADVAAGGAFGPIGALVVRRRGNVVGWVMLGLGACLALEGLGLQYAIVAATGVLSLPGWHAVLMTGLAFWALVPGVAGLLFMLFPSGGLPSPRWKPLLWCDVGAWTAIGGLSLINPRTVRLTESTAVDFPNPLGIQALAGVLGPVLAVLAVIGIGSVFGGIASLVVRFRRGSPDDRERIKWLAYVGGVALLFLPVEFANSAVEGDRHGDAIFYTFFAVIALGLPAAIGAAILRHGLYDIEVVIRKTVVLTALVTFFVAVYAVVVGGIGALVHDASSSTLSFAAAALVAVLSQPALARSRRFADVVVYGRRATPYEVLAEFSGVVGGTRSHEAVLEEMARVVGEGAGARQAGVWLRLGRTMHLSATWPARPQAVGATVPEVALAGDSQTALPALPAEVAVAVSHDGELLGALTLAMPPSDPASDATRRLVEDLAGQAGLVLRNVQLIEDLRASRRRLVAAGDEARRRLERNLHDGAQQQLIGLRLRLRLAEAALDDPDLMRSTLEDLGEAAQSALDDLRDLARGIYPPLLAERGLVAALEGQARKSPVTVSVEAVAVGRFPEDAEAAVYFCSLEALQNVAKYAEASCATVRLWHGEGSLWFAVTDDGAGFETSRTGYGTGLQGMADRLSALGGDLRVESSPGSGTTVTGRIPATPRS